MGLEFNLKLKKGLPRVYSFLKNFYPKRFIETRNLKRRLKKNCDIWYIDDFIKKGTKFPHPIGIVITTGLKIGIGCKILQNVTIAGKDGKAPVIEDNVLIGAGSIIIGDVHVGSNSIIGAGSVITKEVPSNSVVYNERKLKIVKLEK